jgi:hypothetical protein
MARSPEASRAVAAAELRIAEPLADPDRLIEGGVEGRIAPREHAPERLEHEQVPAPRAESTRPQDGRAGGGTGPAQARSTWWYAHAPDGWGVAIMPLLIVLPCAFRAPLRVRCPCRAFL